MKSRLTSILVLTMLLLPACLLHGKIKRSAGTSLCDGKTLEDWDGNPKFWSVKEGVITGHTTESNPTQGNTFLIWRAGMLENFQLDLEFRMVGGNSGVQYRSKDLGNWVVGGYQADIDAGFKFIGILYEERGRGILAMRGTKVEIGENGEKKTVGKPARTRRSGQGSRRKSGTIIQSPHREISCARRQNRLPGQEFQRRGIRCGFGLNKHNWPFQNLL